ncbi:hypothetical protein D1AOALGA4SA_8558 [Olavius algarvensis Delta 1 endosymbiont]|nr:hypothetical protein D1AOALGA4SA_8558 [Olavius algarvensis Delta 1 endosymbiont]
MNNYKKYIIILGIYQLPPFLPGYNQHLTFCRLYEKIHKKVPG